MTTLVLEARRPRYPLADDGFEVSYVPDGGAEHRVPLVQAWAVPLGRDVIGVERVPQAVARLRGLARSTGGKD
jgi:hypothetical protein